MKIKITKEMQQINEFFKGIKFYYVGGCVRDSVMGNSPKDYDLITPLLPVEVERYIKAQGKRVWKQGAKFGTLGVKIGQEVIEITTYRKEDYKPKDRKPEVQYTVHLLEDLSRRDFTCNTLVADINGSVKDNYGGLDDINEKIIRAVGFPKQRFKEDPLRILRGIRFAVKYGFDIEEVTQKKLKSSRWRLLDISKERIVSEVNKIMLYPEGVRTLFENNIFQVVIPQLHLQKRYEQDNPHHDFLLDEHTCRVVNNIREEMPDGEYKYLWAGLLHDVAKPFVAKKHKDGTRTNYINHELLGSIMAQQICRDLKMSNNDRKFIVESVANHIQPDCWMKTYDNDGKVME
jgi:tRNA nucleotidyltransferase/poly(A) polymerase